MTMIKAVFSDFDGVIVNSEVLVNELNEKFVKQLGLSYDPQDLRNLIGSSVQMDLWRVIYDKANPPYTYEEFQQKLWDFREVVRRLDYKEIMFEDVPSSFQMLRDHNIHVAVASSSRLEPLKYNLKNCGLIPKLDYIISGEMFENSKPDPEIYITCAKYFEVNPGECVVIEDSYYGIQAGKRAGMFVIAIKDYNFDINQSDADVIVDTMFEAVCIILKMNESK